MMYIIGSLQQISTAFEGAARVVDLIIHFLADGQHAFARAVADVFPAVEHVGKETYLSRDFRETAAQCFPSQAKELHAFFDTRLNVLLAENADASKEKQYHLQRQILPGVAAYETLQRVMPKEEALQTVHGYVEELARTSHKQLAALLHIPGLYRLVPGVFVKSTRSVFGPAAGFDSKELQVGNGIWRVDMMKCPYHDT